MNFRLQDTCRILQTELAGIVSATSIYAAKASTSEYNCYVASCYLPPNKVVIHFLLTLIFSPSSVVPLSPRVICLDQMTFLKQLAKNIPRCQAVRQTTSLKPMLSAILLLPLIPCKISCLFSCIHKDL